MYKLLFVVVSQCSVIALAHAESVELSLGGRESRGRGAEKRSYFNIFNVGSRPGQTADASTNNLTGTITGNVGGEDFTATFMVSAASSGDSSPVLDFRRGNHGSFIGVNSKSGGSLIERSRNGSSFDTLTISFVSLDNSNVVFRGFSSVQAGNASDSNTNKEGFTINGIDGTSSLAASSYDLTASPFHFDETVTSLTFQALQLASHPLANLDLANLGVRFKSVPPKSNSNSAALLGLGRVTLILRRPK